MHGPLTSEQKDFFFFLLGWFTGRWEDLTGPLPIVDKKPSNLHETSMLELTKLKLI